MSPIVVRLLATVLALSSAEALSAPLGRLAPARVGGSLAVSPFTGATRVVRGADGRSVVWVEGRLARLGSRDAAGVWSVVESLGPALGLDRPRSELTLEEPRTEALGHTHALLRRVEGGLPIVDSELVLHFDRAGVLVTVNGHYLPSIAPLPLRKVLPEGLIVTRAVEEAARRVRGSAATRLDREPTHREVVWPSPITRAVEVDVSFAPHLRWRVFLDAATGELLGARNLVRTDRAATGSGLDSFGTRRTLQLYYFETQRAYATIDVTLANGASPILQTLNGQNSTTLDNPAPFMSTTTQISDAAAVDAHTGMRAVHDYFKAKHGRNSWNDEGGDLFGVVHYGSAYGNAFWNGQAMFFGDGDGEVLTQLTKCLDVTAHEMTHGVVEATMGLVYEYQSGALNESFADVFGSLVDGQNWLIGESCVGGALGRSALRDMEHPELGEQPGHMSQYANLPNTEEGDQGGVHVNSGIPNRAATLVAAALGREKLGKIWYRVMAERYLTSTSQFLDLRRAALRACQDLSYGAGCNDVASAFDTVGIVDVNGAGGSCPAHAHAEGEYCQCDTGYTPDATATACVPLQTLTCPSHAHQVGSDCYCDDGYVINAAGTGCVSEREATCPAHSHSESGACVCDDGWQGSPESSFGCQEIEIVCPANARPSSAYPGTCECITGWVPDASATGCEPGVQGCGDETFYGRCQDSLLIYCDADVIKVIECSASSRVCALENTQTGNNCVLPQDDCGGLGEVGECAGAVARWCQQGAVKEVDCGTNGCAYQGTENGYYCNPCPPHASERSGQGCFCDSGYVLDSAGGACVPEGGSTCGTLTSFGECSGTSARWCEAGVVKEEACGAIGCHLLDGSGYRCTCRAHATYTNGACGCDAGYEDKEGQCVVKAPVDDGGGTDTRTRSFGCATSADAGLALLVLVPLMLRRRRTALALALAGLAACATPKEAVPTTTPAPEPVVEEQAAPQPVAIPALHKPKSATEPPVESKGPVAPLARRITIEAGQAWSDPAGLAISVKEVLDKTNACPPDVRCVWSGIVERAWLVVTSEGATTELKLKEKEEGRAGPWTIAVESIDPPAVTLVLARK